MRIAIQGEKGSFHDLAARQYFNGTHIDIVPCSSFDLAVGSVIKNESELALIAIENARAGSILHNYTLIRESGLKIIGEHNLRIEQSIMAIQGQTLSDIVEVWSHPIAIAQCNKFLNGLPSVRLIEKEDTAASARLIHDSGLKGIAAIGPEIAAEMYQLEILRKGVETYKKNFTRFILLSKDFLKDEKYDKASVCFSLSHEPGSLACVLRLLADKGVNLSKIQSVPHMKDDWEYMFFLDLELNGINNKDCVFEMLTEETTDLEILGLYKKKNIENGN